jgi:hypothetical protein
MATNGSSWESGDFMKFVLNKKNHEDKESELMSHSRFRSLVAESVMLMVASSDSTAAALARRCGSFSLTLSALPN